tara:strand:- start:41566 stop:41745 length:180 start_codon:yes stop_codon:yes gene_type:complete
MKSQKNKKQSEQTDNKQISNHTKDLSTIINEILKSPTSGLSEEDKIKFMDIPLPPKKNS